MNVLPVGLAHEMSVLQPCFATDLESLFPVGIGSACMSILLQAIPDTVGSGFGFIDFGRGLGCWHTRYDFIPPVVRRLLGAARHYPGRAGGCPVGSDVG
jgi:hypothetical protein